MSARTQGCPADRRPAAAVGLAGSGALLFLLLCLLLPGGGVVWLEVRPLTTNPRGKEEEGGLRPPLPAGCSPLSRPSTPAHSRASLEPVPYTAKRGEGQGPPTTAALRHEPSPPARDRGRGEGPISCIWLD